MIRTMTALGGSLLLASLAPGAALAQGMQDFALVNATGYQISQVFVAPSKSEDWEEDVLGQDVLDDGETVNIRFAARTRTCNYDLKVIYEDGDEAEWRKFDLCTVSRITIHWNRKEGTTWADYE